MGWLSRLFRRTRPDETEHTADPPRPQDPPLIPAPPTTRPPRASSAPVAVPLRGGETRQVVGEARYQAVLDRIAGGKDPAGVRIECTATLVPESENAFDRNAVRVEIDGQCVGYLSREDAVAYRPVVRRLTERGQVGTCAALIKGGWRKATGEEGHFGVELALASPQTVLRWLDRDQAHG